MNLAEVLRRLKSASRPENVAGMARYGIRSAKAFGVSAPILRALAREIGQNHELSLKLWRTGYLEARALASLIGDPAKVTEEQMDRWVQDFDSWAVCDACCGCLFDKTGFAFQKACEWAKADKEFVKRAGFVMMAALAVHNKTAPDREFVRLLPIIVRGSKDDRNFVRKAVNWALRQIGKRNERLNAHAIRTAEAIRAAGTRPARWIASDALRELRSAAVRRRLSAKRRAGKEPH